MTTHSDIAEKSVLSTVFKYLHYPNSLHEEVRKYTVCLVIPNRWTTFYLNWISDSAVRSLATTEPSLNLERGIAAFKPRLCPAISAFPSPRAKSPARSFQLVLTFCKSWLSAAPNSSRFRCQSPSLPLLSWSPHPTNRTNYHRITRHALLSFLLRPPLDPWNAEAFMYRHLAALASTQS